MIDEEFARVLRGADYAFREWVRSPLIQKFLQIDAEVGAAAAEARLAAGMARLRASALLIGSIDLAITLGVPIAVWVGVFAALGAPIAEARALVKNENFISGFSQGFVMGLLKWDWHHATSRFGRWSPGQANPFDAAMSYIAANAYNDGMRSGFIHASSLNADARKAVLGRIKSLSPSTRAGDWNRLNQISYVIELAAAARRNNLFRTA